MKELHHRDVREGYGDVELPDALARKYPRAQYEWSWKFVFPSHKLSADPRTGVIRRHHVYENYVIRGVARAARAARITKHVSCHTRTCLARALRASQVRSTASAKGLFTSA